MLTEHSLASGPKIAWNNQMKNSCKNYNYRVDMDGNSIPDYLCRLSF